jgi:hypothetical protein
MRRRSDFAHPLRENVRLESLQSGDGMEELISILLSVQDRMEALINQIDSGTMRLSKFGSDSVDPNQDCLQVLRAQRDDLDKAIALARNPQRKVY